MNTQFLTKRVDNAPLIFFRIAFGFLLFWHSVTHVFGPEIKSLYLTPKYIFPFIGFEWLKPLPGVGMYVYFSLMAVAALCVSIGFMYRTSLSVLALLFTGTYLMQKVIYNNHHYLVILLCLLLLLMPANRFASVDAARNPAIKRYSMPQWCRLIFVFQMSVVYVFAAVAKLYPTWMDGTYMAMFMHTHRNPAYAVITQNHYFHLFLAWGGILFDLLIAPLLLYKRTRVIGTFAMLFFHLFNSYSLTIGIFPFLALSLIVFFYPPDVIRERLFWLKKEIPEQEIQRPESPKALLIPYLLLPYAVLQLLLPLRHYLLPGNVEYTQEGHRLSWRMKLHQKSITHFVMYIQKEGTTKMDTLPLNHYFTKRQLYRFPARPDMIWQAAQYIKQEYAKKHIPVNIYCSSKVSINNLPPRQLLDTTANLAHEKWEIWKHSRWVLKND